MLGRSIEKASVRGCRSGMVRRNDSSIRTRDGTARIGKNRSGAATHWEVPIIGEPAVSPMNNAAENALREPVVLRKLIGTLRNDRGMFVHETLLSLLATWSQQGRNPYEELKRVTRDNEMIYTRTCLAQHLLLCPVAMPPNTPNLRWEPLKKSRPSVSHELTLCRLLRPRGKHIPICFSHPRKRASIRL